VPVYVAAAAVEGTAILILVAGNVAEVTLLKPADEAVVPHTIEYVVGLPVVAEIGCNAVVVPLHTLGELPSVIVASVFTTIEPVFASAVLQPEPL
jgi:hypothetical protein